jgi:hypothetical protein
MRFKPGQQVVCRRDDKWSICGPADGDVVTVDSFSCKQQGYTFIFLKEWNVIEFGLRVDFNERFFEPLMSISELTEILEHQPAEL